MSKVIAPDEQETVNHLLSTLANQQVEIDTGEVIQEGRRNGRADTVIDLKSRGVHRSLLVNATKHDGRPEGLSVEAIDLAAKKRREALAQTNGN